MKWFGLVLLVHLISSASLFILTNATVEENECADDETSDTCKPNQKCDDYLEGTGVEQNDGQGKIPDEIVQQVRQTVCDMNAYYAHFSKDERYRFLRPTCINHGELCAFWVVRGQCSAPEYQEFMAKECPLACQLCDDNEDVETRQARAFLDFLFTNLTEAYNHKKTQDILHRKRRRALASLLQSLDMDPKLLQPRTRTSWTLQDGNWLETLNARILKLIPESMLKIYTDDNLPSQQDAKTLAAIHSISYSPKTTNVLSETSVSYRFRGQIMSILAEAMDHLIIRPMQLTVSFAIPNKAAIQALQELHTPIVEMGAGSGYWTALLRHAGIHVDAYDRQGAQSKDHEFYDTWYTEDIHQGDCETVFQHTQQLAETHTLLLIWPNDPDPVDNPQFVVHDKSLSSQPTWDVACLRAYMNAGGQRVVFVGERETVLQDKYGISDSGISATREFQNTLKDRFDLEQRIGIPSMWLNEDDLTIWKRKDEGST
ncbi:expressed unknown protein [Seminavis robusta]|uniref:ShKT domain-containing protein n=1 Tax=Seminavis robusta TaxID=568900 RepID=A0A9N8DKI6_9STRA|nr:expressed unknown protein [Seminavis robusta]|eukprot:Sro178_g078250.1 n/a (486) ;mRNA; r:77512-78969